MVYPKDPKIIEQAVAMILNATERANDSKHDAEGLNRLVEAAKNYLRCQSHLFVVEDNES